MKQSHRTNFDFNVEALRGFVSLLVVSGHIIAYKFYLDPKFNPSNFKYFIPWGQEHLAVLVFFVLSGYVIGLSAKNALQKNDIVPYIKKRALRLYPIYAVSILFTLLICKNIYSFSTIVGNLTFTDIILTPVIIDNTPIWSLQYEVLFYMLFIPVSYFKLNSSLLTVVFILFGILSYFIIPFPLINYYCLGFGFWLAGLTISRYSSKKNEKINNTLLVSCLLLILCLPNYNTLQTIIYQLCLKVLHHSFDYNNQVDFYHHAIRVVDLSYLPYCMLFIIVFANLHFKSNKYIIPILYFVPLLNLYPMYKGLISNKYNVHDFILPTICYVLSLLLYCMRNRIYITFFEKIIMALSKVGSLSYSIYIIHFPLLVLFSRINFFSGLPLFYFLRLILFLTLTFMIAFILEKKFQPWIKRKLITSSASRHVLKLDNTLS